MLGIFGACYKAWHGALERIRCIIIFHYYNKRNITMPMAEKKTNCVANYFLARNKHFASTIVYALIVYS